MTQSHFSPESYLAEIRREIPVYDEFQRAVADASDAGPAKRVLDLGAGTGETAHAVLGRHPDATLVLVDENPAMLEAARRRLPPANVEQTIVGDLADEFPKGPFDLVISGLAVHHLDSAGKRGLFVRVADLLGPGGRFVLGDVVIPRDPRDAITPLSPDYDLPDRIDDLLAWLVAARFTPMVTWQSSDLAVLACPRNAA